MKPTKPMQICATALLLILSACNLPILSGWLPVENSLVHLQAPVVDGSDLTLLRFDPASNTTTRIPVPWLENTVETSQPLARASHRDFSTWLMPGGKLFVQVGDTVHDLDLPGNVNRLDVDGSGQWAVAYTDPGQTASGTNTQLNNLNAFALIDLRDLDAPSVMRASGTITASQALLFTRNPAEIVVVLTNIDNVEVFAMPATQPGQLQRIATIPFGTEDATISAVFRDLQHNILLLRTSHVDEALFVTLPPATVRTGLVEGSAHLSLFEAPGHGILAFDDGLLALDAASLTMRDVTPDTDWDTALDWARQDSAGSELLLQAQPGADTRLFATDVSGSYGQTFQFPAMPALQTQYVPGTQIWLAWSQGSATLYLLDVSNQRQLPLEFPDGIRSIHPHPTDDTCLVVLDNRMLVLDLQTGTLVREEAIQFASNDEDILFRDIRSVYTLRDGLAVWLLGDPQHIAWTSFDTDWSDRSNYQLADVPLRDE